MIPILTADNICKLRLYDGEKCCLSAWANKLQYGNRHRMRQKLLEIAYVKLRGDIAISIPALNDSQTTAESAEDWNTARARVLGLEDTAND